MIQLTSLICYLDAIVNRHPYIALAFLAALLIFANYVAGVMGGVD
jgi:hypothetical protein